MEPLSIYILLFLSFIAFIAGFIDTIAGGGGLITVPALMISGLNPVLALGTNKLQSSISEISATIHFMKKGSINFKKLWIYLIFTGFGACIGGLILQCIRTKTLDKIIPFLLLFVFIYYIFSSLKKNTFKENESNMNFKNLRYVAPIIGFYNGFFGPGTGSIWSIALSKVLKIDLKKATMYAKPLNFSGNIASLIVFLFAGKIYFMVALFMGIGSFAGGKLGAIFVVYKNSTVIRNLFIAMMLISILSLFWKNYF